MNPRVIFFNILVGIPGAGLIFMGMLVLNTLLGLLIPTGSWTMLIILCITSLVVGLLARLIQPYHGFGAATASGLLAALIIFYLSQTSPTGATGLVFGPVGMLVTIGFSILGACVLPVVRKRAK
jgi:hypothetical protein